MASSPSACPSTPPASRRERVAAGDAIGPLFPRLSQGRFPCALAKGGPEEQWDMSWASGSDPGFLKLRSPSHTLLLSLLVLGVFLLVRDCVSQSREVGTGFWFSLCAHRREPAGLE